jgi:hypothetical protein
VEVIPVTFGNPNKDKSWTAAPLSWWFTRDTQSGRGTNMVVRIDCTKTGKSVKACPRICRFSSVMEALALLQSVLEPGERLLWSGPPKRVPATALAIPLMMLIGFGDVFRKVLMRQQQPLPLNLQMEMIAVAVVLVLPIFFYWYRSHQTAMTTYAATDRRLLIAVGPEHEKIRALDLKTLSRVRVGPCRQGGKALFFTIREKESVWTFLTSGEPDKWRGHTWRVEDPDSLQRLIESARTARTVTAA